jgi:hypothetical protein
MPWSDGLDPETIRRLFDRYPGLSFDEMAMLLMKVHLDYAKACDRLGAKIWNSPDELHMGFLHKAEEFPMLTVPARTEQAFRNLFVAAALPDDTAAKPQLPLPHGLKWFTHGQIQQAVKLFAVGMTRNDVAKATGAGSKNATRVRNLIDGGLLPLNEERKLIVSPRVARQGGRLALRYLDERGERWLDPHKDPPATTRGGSA